jgi:hypothetical protein
MIIKQLWMGTFPKYWDITTWAALLSNHLVFCHRDESTNRRVLEIVNIESSEIISIPTKYNCILGVKAQIVYLARISDARSHILIDRIGAFDIHQMLYIWENTLDSLIVEKYKLPPFSNNLMNRINIGNKILYLDDGKVAINSQSIDYKWHLTESLILNQENNKILCKDRSNKINWVKEGLYGNQFQGLIEGQLVFYNSQKVLSFIDVMSGEIIEVAHLSKIRSVTKHVHGQFNVRNELSFENTTYADGLINNQYIIWFSENNSLQVTRRKIRETEEYPFNVSDQTFLSQIFNSRILFYQMENENIGSLLIGTLEV